MEGKYLLSTDHEPGTILSTYLCTISFSLMTISSVCFFKDFIYLFLEKGERREKERERSINVCLPLLPPQLGTWTATQACALTGNRTTDPLFCRPALSLLSHTSQGPAVVLFLKKTFLGLFIRESLLNRNQSLGRLGLISSHQAPERGTKLSTQ